MTLPRQDPEVDALRTDRYLESLLAAADRRADDVPADIALDEGVRDVAARLQRGLVRVHPSFRFEERLAGRLAGAAASMRLAPAAGAESEIGIINTTAIRETAAHGPDGPSGPGGTSFDPLGEDPDEDADEGLRPLLIGGALTSAALSLAGAAFVAWRRSRPESRATRSPMARAVRAARAAREPSSAGGATAGARAAGHAPAGVGQRLG